MKVVAAPRYEPMTWEGEEYVVLANPSLAFLERTEAISGVKDVLALLNDLVQEHPYVDESGAPVPLASVDFPELLRLIRAWTSWLNMVPKG